MSVWLSLLMVLMLPNLVRITSPSRIHFGLLSMEPGSARRFGGAGVMVSEPSLELSVSRASTTTVSGGLTHRSTAYLESWRRHTSISDHVSLQVLRSPPEHVGLGLGTQLGMSVALALDTLFDRNNVDVIDRVTSVGRGLRSAIGAHGFSRGGLIVELGKRAGESLGELEATIQLPAEWRVALVRCKQTQQGLAGADEVAAFEKLPAVPDAISKKLRLELFEKMLPAAETGDFDGFAESVYQYGLAAGTCFAATQGGPFLNQEIAALVDYCRTTGVLGVGQSSWGPTVYCWFPSAESANSFVDRLTKANFDTESIVTSVAPTGANVIIE